MLEIFLVVCNIFWFCNTELCAEWSKIKIGGDQFTISVSALIILIYLLIGAFFTARWYFFQRGFRGRA